MQAAYPDGTRRFDAVREARALQDAKRGADKVTLAKVKSEEKKLAGGE